MNEWAISEACAIRDIGDAGGDACVTHNKMVGEGGCPGAAPAKPTLAQFAAARPNLKPGPRCSVCSLEPKLLQEVHEAERKGILRTVMSSYLREVHNVELSDHRIGRHFRDRHHKGSK